MKRRNLEVMATFSHPIRVELMRMLSRRKMTVDEMAAKLPLTAGGVRPHIAYFVDRKLLHSQRQGRTVRYWLNRERLGEALAEFGSGAGLDVQLVKRWSIEEPAAANGAKKASKKAAKKKAAKKKAAKKKGSAKRGVAKRSTAKRTQAKRSATKKRATKSRRKKVARR